MEDLQLNCITFLFGSIFYFISYGYLRDHAESFVGRAFRDWGLYILIADAVTMAILYRAHYGRSLASEVFDAPEDWEWNNADSKYEKTDLAEKQEYFRGKLNTLDKAEDIVWKTEESLKDLEIAKEKLEHVEALEQNLQDLDMSFRYQPGGPMGDKALQEFESRISSGPIQTTGGSPIEDELPPINGELEDDLQVEAD